MSYDHVDEGLLAPLRARFGSPAELFWRGEVSEREYQLIVGTSGKLRRHDVTLFVFNGERLALIRKPHFEKGLWRTPGGGIEPGEDFVGGALREAREEIGADVELDRYVVVTNAAFTFRGEEIPWRTHVLSARTNAVELAPEDVHEIAEARWGTAEELAGPIRARLLGTGRALWRYRTALHDTTLEALSA